jgi:hypothetical protein
MPKVSKTTIVLAAILAASLVWAVVHFFFIKDTSGAVVSVSGAPESQAEIAFLDLATQLDGISFDTSFLTDSRFANLVDIRNAITPEASGRKDPFAPVQGVTGNK